MSDIVNAARQSEVGRQQTTYKDLIEAQASEIERQLAGAMSSQAFVRSALSVVKQDGMLQQATASSLLGSIMLAAQLRLEIGGPMGEFYLTARIFSRGKPDERIECVPIIGYQGFRELGYRSGKVKDIDVFLIREGDHFEYGANSERGKFFEWVPKNTAAQGPWTHVLAYARLLTGGMVWVPLTRDEVLERRPGNWGNTPWKNNEEAMARKTGIRALASLMPKSVELAKAVEADEKTVSHVPGDDVLVIQHEDKELEAK